MPPPTISRTRFWSKGPSSARVRRPLDKARAAIRQFGLDSRARLFFVCSNALLSQLHILQTQQGALVYETKQIKSC